MELLGVTGKTVNDGYGLIRNCLRAVTDGFGAQKQLWDGYGRLRPRSNRPNSLLMKNPAEQKGDLVSTQVWTENTEKGREKERNAERERSDRNLKRDGRKSYSPRILWP